MAYCWKATPCNPWLNNEFTFCTFVDYPAYHGAIAYLGTSINAGYTLSVESNSCDCKDDFNMGSWTIIGSCPDTTGYYLIQNCITNEQKVVKTDRTRFLGTIKLASDPCVCWQMISSQPAPSPEPAYDPIVAWYADCATCPNGQPCEDSDRTISTGILLKPPFIQDPDKGFKECCFKLTVLASLTDSSKYYNDFNSFCFQKQLPSDTVQFDLINTNTSAVYSLHSNVYGKFVDFGDIQENQNLSYVTVEWRNVLQLLGEGSYQIRMIQVIGGISYTLFSNTYNLRTFSHALANDTIRIDSYMDGKIIGDGINYKGSGYKDSLRIFGFFGREKPIYTQDSLVYKDYIDRQNYMHVDTEFTMQTNDLPECIGTYLQYFLLLGNDILINDYNIDNYSYKYNQLPIMFEANSDPQYFNHSRKGIFEFTFRKKNKDWKKTNC